MERPLIDFVQHTYSLLGVSVKSYGKDSVLLSLPPDCTDLSSIVVELVDKFNVSIDFQLDPVAGPTLLCWYADNKKISSQLSLYRVAGLFVLAAACAAAVVLWF